MFDLQVSFLLILLPLWLIYRKLQFYYRSTSREVRRLDSVARSPIYSSFTETLDGSSTIRAFQKEVCFFFHHGLEGSSLVIAFRHSEERMHNFPFELVSHIKGSSA
jgi:ABC-type multidrug transport system fused ATPase/permease subunit